MNLSDPDLASEPLARLRSSLALVLARAVIELHPDAKFGVCSATDDGVQCDVVVGRALAPADLPALEQRMREILASGEPVVSERLALDEVRKWLEQEAQPYQLELAEKACASANARAPQRVRIGAFAAPTAAPQVHALSEIPADAFQLRAIAGAYFEGDADYVMMTRLSAWAFASAADLAAYAAAVEHALLRDHKKLGRELQLFTFDDEIGPGLPLWLPHGAAIRRELEKLMEELEFDAGFERVATPHLARVELYERTGHLPYYADGMFPFMQQPGDADGAVFALKPMNCPHHHKIFAVHKRSYRELPFRISEYGHVFRYEDSGAVSGLLRMRCMCMNDAHIYCSLEQVTQELRAVLDKHRVVYELLGLHAYRVRLSTRGPVLHKPGAREKFVDDPAGWLQAEALLRAVLVESGMPFFEGPGRLHFTARRSTSSFARSRAARRRRARCNSTSRWLNAWSSST